MIASLSLCLISCIIIVYISFLGDEWYFAKGISLVVLAVIFGCASAKLNVEKITKLLLAVGVICSLMSLLGEYVDLSELGWRYDTLSNGAVRVFNTLQYFTYLGIFFWNAWFYLLIFIVQLTTYTGTSTYLVGFLVLMLRNGLNKALVTALIGYLVFAIFSENVCRLPANLMHILNDVTRGGQLYVMCASKFNIFGSSLLSSFPDGYQRAEQNVVAVEFQLLNIALRTGFLFLPFVVLMLKWLRSDGIYVSLLAVALINSMANPVMWSFPFLYIFYLLGRSMRNNKLNGAI